MPRECAFCTHVGPLSNEHIFAKWVRDLLSGPADAFYIGGASNRNERFATGAIDWKAKVVCSSCNNTWMSEIEEVHAKPVLTPLVTGSEIDVPIAQAMARSIAIYAFKTAVVQDHAGRRLEPFFSARLRHAFKATHSIPGNVRIWICGIKQKLPNVQVLTAYYTGQISPTYPWTMYVSTFEIGHFVMQIVAVKQFGQIGFRPLAGYENIGIPVWPGIPADATWPGRYVLDGNSGQFLGFAKRWERVQPLPPE
jgi:hypothetical protein